MDYLAVTLIDWYEDTLLNKYDGRDTVVSKITKIKYGKTKMKSKTEMNEELTCLYLKKDILSNEIRQLETEINELQTQLSKENYYVRY